MTVAVDKLGWYVLACGKFGIEHAFLNDDVLELVEIAKIILSVKDPVALTFLIGKTNIKIVREARA